MADYPYTSNVKKLKEFIETIISRNVPDKVNQPYLEKIGFTSKNDRPIIQVLKYINFIDSKNVPTENYNAYLDTTKQKTILAKCIKEGYSKLYQLYSDAHTRDNEVLTNFFRQETKLGEGAVKYMLLTFKALCELADFGSDGITTSSQQQIPVQAEEKGTIIRQIQTAPQGMTIHLNVQLHLPTTEDTTIYDAIFKSMRKYLFESEKKDD